MEGILSLSDYIPSESDDVVYVCRVKICAAICSGTKYPFCVAAAAGQKILLPIRLTTDKPKLEKYKSLIWTICSTICKALVDLTYSSWGGVKPSILLDPAFHVRPTYLHHWRGWHQLWQWQCWANNSVFEWYLNSQNRIVIFVFVFGRYFHTEWYSYSANLSNSKFQSFCCY